MMEFQMEIQVGCPLAHPGEVSVANAAGMGVSAARSIPLRSFETVSKLDPGRHWTRIPNSRLGRCFVQARIDKEGTRHA